MKVCFTGENICRTWLPKGAKTITTYSLSKQNISSQTLLKLIKAKVYYEVKVNGGCIINTANLTQPFDSYLGELRKPASATLATFCPILCKSAQYLHILSSSNNWD